MSRAWAIAGVLMVLCSVAPATPVARAFDDIAEQQAVVLSGAQVAGLLSVPVNWIWAYRYDGATESFVQVPVQADERAVVDFGTMYHRPPSGYTMLTYTGTTTFTGPDPDPLFDADDEFVLMATDAGMAATALDPPGTISGSGIELVLTDPLRGGTAYAYLFASDGTLDPGAGIEAMAQMSGIASGRNRPSVFAAILDLTFHGKAWAGDTLVIESTVERNIGAVSIFAARVSVSGKTIAEGGLYLSFDEGT